MKKIKIVTITLAIVAITMIAFLGIYTQKQNRMENQVKDYELAMDLKGSRNIRLKVNSEEESNNVENFNASKKIIETRLEKLGVSNYIIKLDEQTGDMIIELTENDVTDQIVSNISTIGKFEIIDSQTNEVLMNNQDIKQARVMYGLGSGTNNSGTSVYLEIEFNKEGSKKLEEISNTYVETANQEKEEKEETTESETTDQEETKDEKKITMKIDDEEIMSTTFEEPVKTGKLQLSIGSASTDRKTLQNYVNQASNMAIVLDTGNLPTKYELDENQYVLSDVTKNEEKIAIYVVLTIIVLALIVLIIKHKILGVLGVISYIGFTSLLMIIIKYTNVILSTEGVLGIIMALGLDYILVNKLVAKVNTLKEVYKDFFIKIVPIIIMVITFCFINWTPISSFGMTMFWGISLIAVYNSIVTNGLLKIQTRKGK